VGNIPQTELDRMAEAVVRNGWHMVPTNSRRAMRTARTETIERHVRRQPKRRITAGKRKKKGESKDREPGQLSSTLRRRMGNALADIFDTFGGDIYSDMVLALKESLKDHLQQGVDSIEGEVKEELGRRGVEEAREHFRSWMNEFVEDLIHYGMDEASVTVEELADSLVAEFSQEGAEEGEGDELFDVEEIEVVEEEDVEEPAEEGEAAPTEEGGGEFEELDLEALELAPAE